MFRILKTEDGPRALLTIGGQVSGDHIDAIETRCNQAIATGRPVDLFLRDVSTVDPSGRALLWRLAAKGVRLLGTGVYTSYLVQALSRPGRERR